MLKHAGIAGALIQLAKNGKVSQVALQKAIDDLVLLEPKLIGQVCIRGNIEGETHKHNLWK